MSANVRAALLALAAFGIFSTHDVIVKVLGSQYAPVQVLFFSVLLGFPVATLSLMGDSTSGTLLPARPGWMALRTVATVITGICGFYAFSVLPLAQVYSILFASPLLITVLSIPILGEKVRIRRWMAVLVGLAGVMVVLRPGATPLTLGHLAALTAACGASTAAVIVRKIGHEERPVVLLLYPMAANFLIMGALLGFVYEPMPASHLGLVALMAAMAWAAQRLTIAAYSGGEAAIVAPMQYSQILWASAYGLIFFDETIDAWTALGASIIIASGIYILLRESHGGSASLRPVSRTRSRPETGTYLRTGQLLRLRNRRPEEK